VTGYPEHDKLQAAQPRTEVIGEFLEWLEGQGIQLMTWREDLTDSRPVDVKCAQHRRGEPSRSCDPDSSVAVEDIAWWVTHCMHWHVPERDAADGEQQGTCCRCGKGRFYVVTGIHGFVHERRGTEQLLADYAGIDLRKIEAEKRQMLAAIRSAGEARAS